MNNARQNEKDKALEGTRTRQARVPRVDIYENDQELLLLADMPGVGSEQLKLAFEPPELRSHVHGGRSHRRRGRECGAEARDPYRETAQGGLAEAPTNPDSRSIVTRRKRVLR